MFYKNKVKEIMNNDANFSKMCEYVEMIEKWNKNINLTGYSGDDLWREGIYESLISFSSFKKEGNWLDIGAGAGFPSVPVKIAYPEIQLTIIEPMKKRVNFLSEVNEDLNLNINFINKRAEDIRELTVLPDVITARAVAPLHALIEISHHLGKVGTQYVWIKGPRVFEEVNESEKISKILNVDLKVNEIKDQNIEKHIYTVAYKKKDDTKAGFPREWRKIKNKENL